MKNSEREQIKLLREDGANYKEIAIKLNKNYEAVKKYCLAHGLGCSKEERILPAKIILERFKTKYPDFEYIDGYDNCESKIRLKCKKCGQVFERCASILRKNKQLRCNNCLRLKREELNRTKELEKLQIEKERIEVKSLKQKEYNETHIVICQECGSVFTAKRIDTKCCSIECRNKRENRQKEINRRHKLKENGRIDWDINLNKLIKRDKGVCKICNKKVSTNDYYYDDKGTFIAGESYPSIDHVMPVSKGGTHTWNNVQLAHRGCNNKKRDKTVVEDDNGQFKMCV